MLTIFELVLNNHIGGELANVNALHICLVIIMIIMMIITITMIVIMIFIMLMIIIGIIMITMIVIFTLSWILRYCNLIP